MPVGLCRPDLLGSLGSPLALLLMIGPLGSMQGGYAMAVEHREIVWAGNLEQALEKARAQKRHVLLDFSAAPA